MKKFLCLFIVGILSLTAYASRPQKLPSMAVTWKNSNSSTFFGTAFKKTIIDEIKEDCMEEMKDSIAGTLELELVAGSILSNEIQADVRFNVYNAEGKLLKQYKYCPKTKYNSNVNNPKRLTIKLGKAVAEQFKNDLANDIELIESVRSSQMVYYPMGNDAGKHVFRAMDYCDSDKYKKALRELEEARKCSTFNRYNEQALYEVYKVANQGRQQQLRQRAEAWATVGAIVATAALSAATAALVSSKGSSNSKAVTGTSEGSSVGSSQSGGGDSGNSSSSEMTRKTKACNQCNGTGKMPDWSVSEDTGSKTYCSECKKDTNPKHRHVKCTVCKGTGQVFDKWE